MEDSFELWFILITFIPNKFNNAKISLNEKFSEKSL